MSIDAPCGKAFCPRGKYSALCEVCAAAEITRLKEVLRRIADDSDSDNSYACAAEWAQEALKAKPI